MVDRPPMERRIPLVVVTGFLGSGKTTLINRLLALRAKRGPASGPPSLAVIVNELGEVDIDGVLLGGKARQVELPGGCVCCVLGDQLDRSLLELVDSNPQLAAIVLETTGVAEPLPIAWALERAPVNQRVRLALVVTLVDAAHFVASRSQSASVDAQVAYGDVVLVTKADLPHDQAELVEVLRTLAPRAELRLGSGDDHAAWLDDMLVEPPELAEPRDHVHDERCRHGDHGIISAWTPVRGVVDLEELEDQLAALPTDYIRIKGIVRAIDPRLGERDPHWVVVHRVALRVSSEPIAECSSEPRLVGLGHNPRADQLAECVARATIAR